jgi:hypothetical protein
MHEQSLLVQLTPSEIKLLRDCIDIDLGNMQRLLKSYEPWMDSDRKEALNKLMVKLAKLDGKFQSYLSEVTNEQ